MSYTQRSPPIKCLLCKYGDRSTGWHIDRILGVDHHQESVYFVILHLKWKCWILIGGQPGNIQSVCPPLRQCSPASLSRDHQFEYVLGLKSYKDSITKSSNVFTVSVEFFPLKWHIIYCNPSTIEGDTDECVPYLTTPLLALCATVSICLPTIPLRKTWFTVSVYY